MSIDPETGLAFSGLVDCRSIRRILLITSDNIEHAPANIRAFASAASIASNK
jgi:hypothetical protein